MKLLINRIKTEFNKIYGGNKRVGDSLHLEGRRMSDLEVKSAALLTGKSESALKVHHAVYSDNAEKIRSVGLDGEPDVNQDGNPVFKTENQLSVNNTQFVRGVAPLDMEVSTARKLKVGDLATSPVIDVASLVVNAAALRVKDSSLLGGKLETDLYVRRSVDADNADLLNDTPQNQLVVEKARIATKLTTSDNKELKEEELRVYSSVNLIDNNGDPANIYGVKKYILEHPDAKKIIPDLATTAQHITKSGSTLGYTFDNIMTHLKTDTNSEIYKAKRIITADGVKDGDAYKTWIIGHNDFKDKVGTLNAATANRATKLGDTSTSYTATELITHIQEDVTIAQAANATKLQNNTPDDLFTTIRGKILTNAGANLSQPEVDGFFGAAKVKLAVQGIKSDSAINSDTLETKTLAQIKQIVKDEGQVLSAKYIYADPNGGGQKSYIDITNDINTVQTTLLGGASSDYNSLGEVETIIKSNKSAIEASLATETSNRTSADATLQSNIDVEKGRINTIVSGADSDKNTFVGLKNYTDTIIGDLNTSTTALGNNVDLSVVNITNALEDRIAAAETSSTTATGSLGGEVDKIEESVGLKTNGGLNALSGDYISTAQTVIDAIELLDVALKAEESSRISGDSGLTNSLATTNANVVTETNERKAADGDLTALTTSAKNNLVSAINELKTALTDEATTRTSSDETLQSNIDTVTTNLTVEVTARTNVDTTLQTNIDNEVTARTTADTTLQGNIDTVSTNLATEISNRTTGDAALQTSLTNLSSVVGTIGDLTTDNKSSVVTAINSLKLNVTTLANNLATETTNRSDDDTALQTNIDNEVTARTDADTTINNRVEAIKTVIGGTLDETTPSLNYSGTNFIDDKVTLEAALKELDAQTKSAQNIAVQFSTDLTEQKVAKTSQLFLDEIINSDITAVVGTRYYVDVTNNTVSITLPSDANNFDRILVHGLAGDFTTNNLTITKDATHTIMKKDEPLIVNTDDETFEMVYINGDWRVL